MIDLPVLTGENAVMVADAFRVLTASVAAVLAGFCLALARNARRHTQLIAGPSLAMLVTGLAILSAAVVFGLLGRLDQPVTWRTPLCLAGALIALTGAVGVLRGRR